MSEQALNELIETAQDEFNKAVKANDTEGVLRMEAHLDDLYNELGEYHRVAEEA